MSASLWDRAISIALAHARARKAEALGRMLTAQEEDEALEDPAITDDVERIHHQLCKQDRDDGAGDRKEVV